MAMTIKGNIYQISPIEDRQFKGKTFYSRNVVLYVPRFDGMTGELIRESYPQFEIVSEQLCRSVENFDKGDIVEVTFAIDGVKYTKDDDERERFFNKVVAYKIEPYQSRQTVVTSSAQSAPFPTDAQDEGCGDAQAKDDLPF